MHDLILLRCTTCLETIRLVIYDQTSVHVNNVIYTSQGPVITGLADWLSSHVAHHPAVERCDYDLDDKPGFEVLTFSQLQDEEDAMRRVPV